jgi:cell division septation protein DedD
MTDYAPLRKALILCAAATLALTLTACDDQNLKESLAKIKEVPVDDGGKPAGADARSIGREDVELVVNTAKDLTMGEGGLLHDAKGPIIKPQFKIAIVDPLKMPTEANAAADTGLEQSQVKAVPVAVNTVVTTRGNRLIQIGSFGSADAARDAWLGLQARYPGIEQYHPVYQKVTTAAGKPMVRLKVGPVTGEDQAQSLCLQLDVRDRWCSKAS